MSRLNRDLVFEIVDLAVSLVKDYTPGNLDQDVMVEEILTYLIERTALAYQEYTGEPYPSLIREEPL
jgi:hypothetical protein